MIIVKRAIVFPGGGYTALGPALRIPALAAEQHGYEPASIEYPADALLTADVDAIIAATRPQLDELLDGADEVVLIPKSFGTRVVAAVTDMLDDVGAENVSALFVTPMFQREAVRDAIIATGWRSLFAVGAADDVRDPTGDEIVASALDATVLAIARANHGLEIPGDLTATMAGFDQLAATSLAFVAAT